MLRTTTVDQPFLTVMEAGPPGPTGVVQAPPVRSGDRTSTINQDGELIIALDLSVQKLN